ncbi:MAG: hypothetical protein JXA36_03980 [Coriobacteriia bacterium]|nr:hypothetical protein [Coriobacteriia bacterium]
MDSALHDALVARISEWFAARVGHEFSVTVHTGPNVVQVAEGPYLGMEEHPVSKGVYRLLFADARRVSINPDQDKYVTAGFELVDVLVDAGRLVLDKGSQRIEIVDVQPSAFPSGDEVDWSVPAGIAAPTVAAVAPAPIAAPAPAPAAPAPTAPPAPAPVAAAPPSAVPFAPASPGGQVFQMRVMASPYGNATASGSGFFGPVDLRIEQGRVTVTGQRSENIGVMMVMGALLLALGWIGILFGLIVAVNAAGDSDMGFAFCLMGVGLLAALSGLALTLVGRRQFMVGPTASLEFALAEARGARVRYDDNTGCLLMLFLTPLIGLIVMLAMGKRIVRMNVPSDRNARAPRQMLVLKTYSSADGAILNAALRG